MKDHVQRSLEDMVIDVLRQLTSSDLHERNNVHVTLPDRNNAVLNFVDKSQSLSSLLGYCKDDQSTPLEFRSDSKAANDENGKVALRKVKFRSMRSAKTFACIFKVARTVLELKKLDKYATKRDVYYSDVKLFQDQSVVDHLVDDFACKFQISRRHLHIVSSGRGVIAGNIRYREAGILVDGMQFLSTGKMIHPIVEQITEIDTNGTNFVLVVEKDAIFMRLIEEEFIQQHRCVVITSKGYPDVATRLFLHKLCKESPTLPIFCLTDFDPHGIEIAMTYFYGAITKMGHQRHELHCSRMLWIGLNLKQDFHTCRIPIECLLEMGPADHAKAQKLNQLLYQSGDNMSHLQMCTYEESVVHEMNKRRWVEALDLMLKSGKKAEIECLNSVSLDFFHTQYLPWKITTATQH